MDAVFYASNYGKLGSTNTWTADNTFNVIKTQHCDAATSAGVHVGNNAHADVAIFGAGGGQGTTFYGQINGTSLALSAGITCTTLTASGIVRGTGTGTAGYGEGSEAGRFGTGNKYLMVGYNTSADRAWLQGVDTGAAWKDIYFQPNGGMVGFAGGGAFGAASLLASERLRVAGGTMGTPGLYDVLLADGRMYCGNTSATSIRTAGGLTAAGDLYFTPAGFRLYQVTEGTVGIASGSATQCFLNLRSSALASYGYIGATSTDFGITDASGNFVLSYQPGSTRVLIPSTTTLTVANTTASTNTTTGCATFAGGIGVAGAGNFGGGASFTGGSPTTPGSGVAIGGNELRCAGAIRAVGLITVSNGYLEGVQSAAGNGVMQFAVSGDANPRCQLLAGGVIRLGDGTVPPTAFVDNARNVAALTIAASGTSATSIQTAGGVSSAKVRLTPEGGIATLVVADEAISVGNICAIIQGGTANRVKKCPISGNENDMPVGVAYTAAASAGDSFWMVVSGRVGVLPETGVTAAQGYIIYTSTTTAGLGAQVATAPAAATHFKEVGHFINTGSGAGAIADAIVHFN